MFPIYYHLGASQYKMSMAFELLLLTALIIIFIASFCGLLQKIRQSYENERERAESSARSTVPSLSEVYVNPTFTSENVIFVGTTGVFPSAPPPYTEFYAGPPPNYEDVIKDQNNLPHVHQSNV